jgi:hypothetical protein
MTQSKDLVQEPIARKWYIIEQTLTSEKNSFSIRISKYWNKLPHRIINKRKLDIKKLDRLLVTKKCQKLTN